ncbi:MAG: hypothetical protein Hyperionvirus5_113 [Hyperionvirus sp.]|uniref:Uncharacterized protein n=1 Tax=Hyperionvirus sp. TaxID=2487770 RepID=A0A3G5A7T3_9VIRU|nr:MAG: hypothetical protein Hyperionvirus5_113 [Hyperionvirus sp.]
MTKNNDECVALVYTCNPRNHAPDLMCWKAMKRCDWANLIKLWNEWREEVKNETFDYPEIQFYFDCGEYSEEIDDIFGSVRVSNNPKLVSALERILPDCIGNDVDVFIGIEYTIKNRCRCPLKISGKNMITGYWDEKAAMVEESYDINHFDIDPGYPFMRDNCEEKEAASEDN